MHRSYDKGYAQARTDNKLSQPIPVNDEKISKHEPENALECDIQSPSIERPSPQSAPPQLPTLSTKPLHLIGGNNAQKSTDGASALLVSSKSTESLNPVLNVAQTSSQTTRAVAENGEENKQKFLDDE